MPEGSRNNKPKGTSKKMTEQMKNAITAFTTELDKSEELAAYRAAKAKYDAGLLPYRKAAELCGMTASSFYRYCQNEQ